MYSLGILLNGKYYRGAVLRGRVKPGTDTEVLLIVMCFSDGTIGIGNHMIYKLTVYLRYTQILHSMIIALTAHDQNTSVLINPTTRVARSLIVLLLT